jgi:hypothetical protein
MANKKYKIEEEVDIPFNEYYKTIYLPAHSKVLCRILHFLGNLFTLAWIVAFSTLAFNSSTYYALALIVTPFVVYPFAWTAHFYIEKNKPLAWSNPFWAKVCDWKMCWEMMTGKIPFRDL